VKGEVWLLDANLLIALTHAAHVHHGEAHAWFAQVPGRSFATCVLTQLAFVRLSCNPRVAGAEITPAQAMQALAELVAHTRHTYWPDAPEPLQMPTLNSAALVGHRQVTDAYLLGLAAHKGQRLATLDRGLLSYADALRLLRHVELVSARTKVQEPRAAYTVKRKKG
jgi:uncharacterized protein